MLYIENEVLPFYVQQRIPRLQVPSGDHVTSGDSSLALDSNWYGMWSDDDDVVADGVNYKKRRTLEYPFVQINAVHDCLPWMWPRHWTREGETIVDSVNLERERPDYKKKFGACFINTLQNNFIERFFIAGEVPDVVRIRISYL